MNKDKQFRIVTVNRNENRYMSQFLKRGVPNIKFTICLEYPDIDYKKNRSLVNSARSLEHYYATMKNTSAEDVKKDIEKYLKGTVINCMGYRHPLHYMISTLVDADYYYAEYPYYYNSSTWCKHVKKRYYEKFADIDTSEVRARWNFILNQVYKNQIKTFWFFQPYYKNHNKEMLFCRPDL